MVERIEELLVKNNCVIIPGFGAFIGNYNSAVIRLPENIIFPPSKSIAFNRTLQANDGLLVNFVAQQETITYQDAEEKVINFSKNCTNSLQDNKSLIFKNIGRFILDVDNNIQFKPLLQKNFLLDSYGLMALSLSPIQRLKAEGVAIKDTRQHTIHPDLLQEIQSPNKKINRKHFWLAAVIVLVCLTGSIVGVSLHKNNPNINSSSLVPSVNITKPIVEKQKDVSQTIPTETVQNSEMPTTSVVIKEVVKSTTNTTLENKSYILIGSFFDNNRADKLKAEADKIGFTTLITNDNKNNLFRVTIAVDADNMETSLAEIKSTLNSRAWVYCTNCTLK